ncbi:hypothetical protein, partial [Lysinibacillus capsici]|uniref:hypothetical protein n=1 Tax=Lysinibacillus capsici TaxID=2115968 RepID=UPI003BA16493
INKRKSLAEGILDTYKNSTDIVDICAYHKWSKRFLHYIEESQNRKFHDYVNVTKKNSQKP